MPSWTSWSIRGTIRTPARRSAIRDALRVLQQRRREDKVKLQALRAQLKLGVDALRRGEFDEVDGADLHVYLKSLTGTGRKPSRPAR
jgi:antitoxin ParD1/3/4